MKARRHNMLKGFRMAKTILVVEDDSANRTMLQIIIKGQGHDVIFTEAAEDALSFLEGDDLPDLIITDLLLTGMNGLEMTHLIKGEPSTAHIPIIAVTACPECFTRAQLESAGFYVLMPKPIRMSELKQCISKCLGG